MAGLGVPGVKSLFLAWGQTGDLGVGRKGQIALTYFKRVGICNGASSTVHSSFFCFVC